MFSLVAGFYQSRVSTLQLNGQFFTRNYSQEQNQELLIHPAKTVDVFL